MPDIQVKRLRHCYGDRVAIENLDLEIGAGELYAIVGPNGGGKTTLFRVLSTLISPQQGEVSICGLSVKRQLDEVRRQLGVVFQSPAVDPKLTVDENLSQQGALYGLSGRALAERKQTLLEHLGLTARRRDYVETLSGGLRRRVDLAKGMLHRPRVLLLDEPSTGIDPGARRDLWHYLQQLRREAGTTILLTTHLLEEADQAERIGILDRGALVAEGKPDELKQEIGSAWVLVSGKEPQQLADDIRQRYAWDAQVLDGQVRLDVAEVRECVNILMQQFNDRIQTIAIGKPTLEDVFLRRTGHRFWQPAESSQC